MRVLSIILIILGSPAASDGFVFDAFGVVPTTQLSAERKSWSGLSIIDGIPTILKADRPEVILFYVGPKSIAAGRENAQAVALILDEANNPVSGSALVDFHISPEDRRSTAIVNGIAETTIDPGTIAKVVHISASVENLQSSRESVRITSDLSTVRATAPTIFGIPKYEEVSEVETSILVDRFGNIVEDGVSAKIIVQHLDGRSTLLSPVVRNGAARAPLLARDMPEMGRMRFTLGESTSNPASLNIEPVNLLGRIAVSVSPIESLSALRVNVGPILTDAGHHLSDGAEISVFVTGADGGNVGSDGWLLDGSFETILPISPANGPFDFEITTGIGTQQITLEIDNETQAFGSENK